MEESVKSSNFIHDFIDEDLAAGVKALNDFVQTYRQPDYNFNASTLDDFIDEYVFQKKIEFDFTSAG